MNLGELISSDENILMPSKCLHIKHINNTVTMIMREPRPQPVSPQLNLISVLLFLDFSLYEGEGKLFALLGWVWYMKEVIKY